MRYLASDDRSGMIAQTAGEIVLVPFDKVVGSRRCVDVEGDPVQTGRDLGIAFGDLPTRASRMPEFSGVTAV